MLGPERDELLGLLRTQELLAARAIDGAEQYFTRAIDFGYSRSPEDTLSKWDRDLILGDIVWLIRRLKPDVVIQTIEGASSGRHGHHLASDQLVAEAFECSGDRKRFPGQLSLVHPWRATRLVRVLAGAAPEGPATEVDATQIDPLEGVPLAEIARRSRAMHRSQGFDSPLREIPLHCWLAGVAGTPAGRDVFDQVDTTWNRIPGGDAVGPEMEEIARAFDPEHPGRTAERLAHLRPRVATLADSRAQYKLAEMDELIAFCLGARLAVTAGVREVVPGASLTMPVEAAGGERLLTVPRNQPYTQPYWLRLPHGPYAYAVEQQQLAGLAEQPPGLAVRLSIRVAGEEIEFERPVMGPDNPASPVAVVPRVSLSLAERVYLFPDGGPRPVTVHVRSRFGAQSGRLALTTAPGWRAEPAVAPFEAGETGEPAVVSFSVTPPARQARDLCRAAASIGGEEFSRGVVEVAYPGLPRRAALVPAAAILLRTDVQVAARSIGYVMGPGDEVPDALRQMGCRVTLLDSDALNRGGLARFEAVVAGVRAFNVRPDLRENLRRIMEYVQAGGTLVVQYNVANRRSPEQAAEVGPFPLRIGRDRVVAPDAPVALLDPEHPLLSFPNRITGDDFGGWVQERGLYFAAGWDRRYSPLFECHDPGEKPLQGATLYARYGEGAYIFTALSWFRQLPAGVAGAYRIFANFVSASKTASRR